MPENTIPWGVTHFIGPTWTDSLVSSVHPSVQPSLSRCVAGGAVMGQFPELCYSSLLQPFVDKTGMAVPWLQFGFDASRIKFVDSKMGMAWCTRKARH